MQLTFGSGCSGIEAASVAWEPLGWKPSWFAQFDPEHDYKRGPDFPSAVLAYHWPDVPNYRDMTLLAGLVRFEEIEAPDVLVAGTPCQSFSIAGLRAGLSDARGGLTLAYVELANAVDDVRISRGAPPRYCRLGKRTRRPQFEGQRIWLLSRGIGWGSRTVRTSRAG